MLGCMKIKRCFLPNWSKSQFSWILTKLVHVTSFKLDPNQANYTFITELWLHGASCQVKFMLGSSWH